jgi:4,5-dihydroxyphthalate decarboxylase
MSVRLTLACGHYDRTEALRDGSIKPEGVELTYVDLPPEETFFRMARFQEFDAAEMSLSSYVNSLGQSQPLRAPARGSGQSQPLRAPARGSGQSQPLRAPARGSGQSKAFVAIPVFPSRMFRHSGIYVNARAGIGRPEELIGRSVGVAEYQLTANVWIRGILAEHHGVPVASVRYRTGGLHTPGRVEKLAVKPPADVEITPIDEGQTLAEMLVAGEIDALYTPRLPAPFAAGRPEVVRLFPDSGAVEREYFAATGIFPIMHVVVLRRDVYERDRWLATSLVKAFELARQRVLATIGETAALSYLLPWLHDELRRTRAVLGHDYWTYGLGGNEATLHTFLRYAYEQGIAARLYAPEELFAPETLESAVV